MVGNVQLQSVAVWGVESFHGVMLMPRSESDDRGWHAGLSFLSRLLLCVLCFFLLLVMNSDPNPDLFIG